MVMHSNEREECCPCTLVDRQRKRLVDVVVRLHGTTDHFLMIRRPPRSTHVQLDDVPRTLDPAKCLGRVPSSRRHGDGDGEVIRAGLRLSTM